MLRAGARGTARGTGWDRPRLFFGSSRGKVWERVPVYFSGREWGVKVGSHSVDGMVLEYCMVHDLLVGRDGSGRDRGTGRVIGRDHSPHIGRESGRGYGRELGRGHGREHGREIGREIVGRRSGMVGTTIAKANRLCFVFTSNSK